MAAPPTVDTNFKTTIAFATTGAAFAPEILSVKLPGRSVEKIPTTHQGTTTDKTYLPGRIKDNGDLEFTFHYQSTEVPPVGVVENITVTLNHRGTPTPTTTITFSGFVLSFDPPEWDLDEKMIGRCVVAVTGDVTVAPSA